MDDDWATYEMNTNKTSEWFGPDDAFGRMDWFDYFFVGYTTLLLFYLGISTWYHRRAKIVLQYEEFDYVVKIHQLELEMLARERQNKDRESQPRADPKPNMPAATDKQQGNPDNSKKGKSVQHRPLNPDRVKVEQNLLKRILVEKPPPTTHEKSDEVKKSVKLPKAKEGNRQKLLEEMDKAVLDDMSDSYKPEKRKEKSGSGPKEMRTQGTNDEE